MIKKTSMCILFSDETVDTVYIDRSVLGVQIKFMKRLPRDENIFAAIAELVESTEKTPSKVVLCIPRSSAIQRTLRYPAAVRDEIATMVQFEATRHVPLPEDDRLLAWSTAESSDEKQIVLNLVAARRRKIHELIEGFERAGVPIDAAVPFNSLATTAFGDVSSLVVLVDATHVELCLYGKGMLQDSQLIRRDVPGFGDDRVIVASRQMTAKHKAWLGDEGIGRILIGGPETLSENFEEDLGATFGLHVRQIEVPEEMAGFVAEGMVPTAEALLASSVESSPTLNLIENRHRKVPPSKRTIIVSSLCLLLLVELVATYALKISAPTLQRRVVVRKNQAMSEQTKEILTMKNKNRIFRKQLRQLEQVCGSRAGLMEILKTVSDVLPEDSYLQRFNYDGEKIVLKGFSKAPEKLPELIMAIPFVETISESEIGRKTGDYHEFNLNASMRR